MRAPRLLGEGKSLHHCVSRVVDRWFAFGTVEKDVIRKTNERPRVVIYCLMFNHFYVLVEVPDAEGLSPLSRFEP